MEYRAHRYQEYAKEMIIKNDMAGLFLEMGLGKTVAALTAVDELMFDYFDVSRVLVVAPLRVAQETWTAEAQKWDHLRHLKFSKVLGSAKERAAALQKDADIYLINRENIAWLAALRLKKWPFDMIIIDELSSFKSPGTARFRSMRKLRPLANKVVGLTGTPAPKGLIDLWAQVYLLDRGERLGKTMGEYKDRYFKPGKQDRSRHIVFEWLPREGSEEKIYEKLSDICVSMKAEDWLELPERIDRTIEVKLEPEHMKQYKELERSLIVELQDEVITAGTAAAVTGKLQQFAQGAVYKEGGGWLELHNAKLAELDEIIEEANSRPVLVFYWYKHDEERLRLRYKKARVLNTEKDIKDWNDGKIPIMLVHPASAGHGLNLQAGGNIIVWYSLTWSLELYQQGNARLHRQGQKESVIIHHLVAAGTVDEDIIKALSGKSENQNALMEAVKARIEKLKV